MCSAEITKWEQKVSRLVLDLKDCQRNRDLKRGSEIHSQVNSCGLSRNKYVVTSLIKMYSDCGSMPNAKQVFDHSRLHNNVVAWNCLIFGYVENGESEMALDLFGSMQSLRVCHPCSRTFVAALTACANLAAGEGKKVSSSKWLERGSAIHSLAVENRCCDMFVESALVDFYSKCGCMKQARSVFESMVRCDVVAWTALLQGYAENGHSELALELYEDLIKAGKVRVDGGIHVAALSACAVIAGDNSGKNVKEDETRGRLFETGRKIHSRSVKDGSCNIFVESMVLNLYGRCGRMPEARHVFYGLLRKDVVCWNALLQGYFNNGENVQALDLFQKMVNDEDVTPNARTYVVAISALAAVAKEDQGKTLWLQKGKELHSQAVINSCCDKYVKNSLITMYSHCGGLSEARNIFDSMSDEERDAATWNALITGFLDNDQPDRALETVAAMDTELYDSRTYVTALVACTSLLAVETGRAAHACICCRGEDCTAVSNCLLDFYSKCGSFDAGIRVFDSMVEPRTVVSWNSLMYSYSSQGDTERVFEVFHEMLELGLRADEITFVCLLTSCKHGGLLDVGKKVFDVMEGGFGVSRTVQHFNCMVDLLGRGNRIEEALRLVRGMPFEGNDVTWRGVLCACRKWNNIAVGKVAYDELVRLDVKDSSAYVILWRMLDAAGVSEDKSLRVPGVTSWIDPSGTVHSFKTELSRL